MKACPHCGGQIRPSVIRCVHCGTSLVEEAEGSSGDTVATDLTASTGGRRPVAAPAQNRTVATAPKETARPAGTSTQRPTDVWATPLRVRAPRLPPAESGKGATSRTSIRQIDLPLMAGGTLAALAGALAYSSLAIPWVHARLWDASAETDVVADMTFRGSDSIAGPAGVGIAIGLGLLGLVWFWYGLDRGAGLPAIAHPASALALALLATVLVLFAGIGYFFWNDAFVAFAQEAGMTKRAMRDLLETRPAPSIAIERLSGLLRFAAAAGLASLAGTLVWWIQRRRG